MLTTPEGRTSRRKAFTMVEVAISTAIVALGVTALMVGVTSTTKVNGASHELSQATLLAQELREWSITLPFFDPQLEAPGALGLEAGESKDDIDDLDDLHGQTFSPPCDASGYPMSIDGSWAQQVTISWMDPSDVSSTSASATDVVSVQATILHNGDPVLNTSWIVTRRD